MRIRGVNRFKREIRQIQKRLASSKGLILMYHRVAERDLDPWKLSVTPRHFAEQLAVLREYAHPIGLRELARKRREGRIPRGAVALTFDDGYANNFHHAKPLLTRYGIPATVFVTTGYLGEEREFWWDELEKVLLTPGKLPGQLGLALDGRTYRWELGEATDYTEEDYRRDRDIGLTEARTGSRTALYHSLWQTLQPLPEARQREALDRILDWSGGATSARPTHRPLTPEELLELGQGGLIEIGAHTVTHPRLSAHSPDFQALEIERSKKDLEERLEIPVTTFAYPYGDYRAETVHLVHKAGFECACSTVEEVVWRGSDGFQLPRFEVHDWNGEEFTERLRRWLGD